MYSSSYIAIILLDYNSQKLTKQCIESIKQRLEFQNYQIVLVDNSENTQFSDKFLSENNITYIKNTKNTGFASGCNIGIKYAQKLTKFDYYWLLNNDATVSKDTLISLVSCAKKNNFAITGSKIINPKNNQVQCLAGGYLNRITGKTSFIAQSNDLRKLEYICGASMLISNNTIEQIGLLDEDFFLYYEDAEYCYRAIKNNLRIGYEKNSIIHHVESSTTGKIPENKILHTVSSFIIYCFKTKRYITCFNGILLRFCYFCFKLKWSYLNSFFKAIYIGLKRIL